MPPDTPLVKTVQIADAEWQAFRQAVETESADGFRAFVRFETSDRYLKADEDALRAAFRDDNIALILVADDLTFSDPRFPVLCIDPENNAPSFRAAVRHLWVVENNVSTGNLLFEELAEDQTVDGWLTPDGF